MKITDIEVYNDKPGSVNAIIYLLQPSPAASSETKAL